MPKSSAVQPRAANYRVNAGGTSRVAAPARPRTYWSHDRARRGQFPSPLHLLARLANETSDDRLDAAVSPFHHADVMHAVRGGNMGGQSMQKEAASGSRCDILVTNGYVVTLDAERRTFERGAVAITDRRIVAVGPVEDVVARYRAQRTLDARGGT